MTRTRRQSLMAGVGCALLAVIVLCPLMATAAATPSVSSCHDRQAPDHHGDTSAAFTCCATVVVKPSVQAAPEADATLAPTVDAVRHPAQQTGWHANHPRPGSASPPLFVRYASLRL